jgi:hypothetical protein
VVAGVVATAVVALGGVVGSPLDWTAELHAVPTSTSAVRSAVRQGHMNGAHMNGDGSADPTRSGIMHGVRHYRAAHAQP